MDADTAPPPDDFVSLMKGLRSGSVELDDCPEPFVESLTQMMQRSREELRASFRHDAEREARAPGVGTEAPDFALELLSPAGERTGEVRRLSAHLGRPVALVFGSYT